ncbi:MAG: hypothetical protein ACK56F_18510 [bacterium]
MKTVSKAKQKDQEKSFSEIIFDHLQNQKNLENNAVVFENTVKENLTMEDDFVLQVKKVQFYQD